MRKFRKSWLFVGLIVVVIGYLAFNAADADSTTNPSPAVPSSQTTQSSTSGKANTKASKTVDWTQPSQTQAYPDLTKYPQAWLDVNIGKQRVYVRDGANRNQVLYTMYCSTGKNNATPRGTYAIQAERGPHFYNASEQEGANYYVSWKNHGEYLFHSVPVDANGNYVKSVADNIGHKASSHGCVQLPIPDAKWVYENVPYGMKVVVH